MDLRIVDIRRRVAREGGARPDDIDAVDDLLEAEGVSVELLILRGQLIQLVADGRADELEEAFACYQEAIELGAGPSAEDGLREALDQLESEEP